LDTPEVPQNRNHYIQIDDIEMGNRPETKHDPEPKWENIGDIEFF